MSVSTCDLPLEQESKINPPPVSPSRLPNPGKLLPRETRSQERWLLLARAGWIIIVMPTLIVYIASMPGYFAALHHLAASNTHAFTGQLTPGDLQRLQPLGLSVDFYAAFMLAVSLLFQLSYALTGGLLFWRKSGDPVALLASFALVLFPFGFADLTLQALPAAWHWLIPKLIALGNISIMICAYVFPDGRFVPGFTRWLALIVIGYWATVLLPAGIFQLPRILDLVLFFGLILSTMLVQLYRYRYVADPQQRQQTKWVVYGISIAVVLSTAARLLTLFVLLPRMPGSAFPGVLEVSSVSLSMLSIPPTLAIAILRYRLWDIDVIINRTLVYGSLTALLVGLYVGLILALQALVQNLTGAPGQHPLVIVASTLVIAALFQPLRRRLQKSIDRRFYRRKYDAGRVVAAFSDTLRQEVDLDQLRDHLLAVVQETMQPAHVSLWLLPHEPA